MITQPMATGITPGIVSGIPSASAPATIPHTDSACDCAVYCSARDPNNPLGISQEELHDALVNRHGAALQSRLDKAIVGVAGLGGLGSHIAVHLARLGIGRLVLVDFDVVDISNLNRQQYTLADIGMPKTQALLHHLQAVNPYLVYAPYTERITAENAARLFAECDIVCEAFDHAEQKAMLIETLLTQLPNVRIVAGNGMAGYGSANAIGTAQPIQRLYVSGDGQSDLSGQLPLMEPRVAVCAAHQAMMVLRLVAGEQAP